MEAGDVVCIWLDSEHLGGEEGKLKYAVRVDAKEHRFLLINSEPRRTTPDDNMPLPHADAEYLPKEVSYIDTSRVIGLTPTQFREGMAKRGAKELGKLADKTKAKLVAGTKQSKVLIKWQKVMIARNLSPKAIGTDTGKGPAKKP